MIAGAKISHMNQATVWRLCKIRNGGASGRPVLTSVNKQVRMSVMTTMKTQLIRELVGTSQRYVGCENRASLRVRFPVRGANAVVGRPF